MSDPLKDPLKELVAMDPRSWLGLAGIKAERVTIRNIDLSDVIPPESRGRPWYEASSTYQAILNQGRVEGMAEASRIILLRLGLKRFGAPTPEALATIETITNLERLDQLADRLLDVTTWDEFLAGP